MREQSARKQRHARARSSSPGRTGRLSSPGGSSGEEGFTTPVGSPVNLGGMSTAELRKMETKRIEHDRKVASISED